MSEKRSHIISLSLKILGGTLLFIVIAAVLLRFSLNTDFVRSYVKGKIESTAKESLTVNFEIDSVTGDLWKEVRIKGIYGGDADTLFYINSVYLSYDLLTFFSGAFEIDSLIVDDSYINIIQSQHEDSLAFNIQKAVLSSDSESSSSLEFNVQSINLNRGFVDFYASEFLPDSSLSIENITFDGSAFIGENNRFTIEGFSFQIKEGRLPEPIDVSAAGSFKNEEITFKDLLIQTGRSVLNADAFVNLRDSLVENNTKFSPLSFSDIDNYIESELPDQDLQLALTVEGALKEPVVKLSVRSPMVNDMNARARLTFREEPALLGLSINMKEVSLNPLFADTLSFTMDSLNLFMDGRLTKNYEKASVEWDVSVFGLTVEDYNLKSLQARGSIAEGDLNNSLTAFGYNQDSFSMTGNVTDVFGEEPQWFTNYEVKNINLANWSSKKKTTELNLNGTANGTGFELSENPITFEASNRKNNSQLSVHGQNINLFELSGSVFEDSLEFDSRIRLDESLIDLEITALDFLTESVSFGYEVQIDGFDFSELKDFEDFPTDINAEISGEGKGMSLEELFLNGNIKIDSSTINNADLTLFKGVFSAEDGILSIPEANLESDIAKGTFRGNRNIMDKKDPENVLFFNLELLTLQPFAPLANLDTLDASGTLEMIITENEEGVLVCNAGFVFNDFVADHYFLSSEIDGDAEIILKENELGIFNLIVSDPVISGTPFQDIELSINSEQFQDSVSGDFLFKIESDNDGRIESRSDFVIDIGSKNAFFTFTDLIFASKENVLSLQNEFHVSYENEVISTDTLEITSGLGAFLSMAIPYADTTEQQLWVVGENFNFGEILEVAFNERFVDGVLSGQLNLRNTRNEFSGNGDLNLQNIVYQGAQADVIALNFDAAGQRVKAGLEVYWDNERAINGTLDIPFQPGNPDDFSDQFFEQPVSGTLEVIPTSLERFQTVLDGLNISNSSGIISFTGLISGTAAAPKMRGDLSISKPQLSDIPLDTVFANFDYNQLEERLEIHVEMDAANQKAAVIDINYPFAYNFKTLETETTSDEKPLSATILTQNFNLAVLNDFLDKEYTTDLRGLLNGELDVSGNGSDLAVNGGFNLTGASASIPIAGIKVDNVSSDIQFENDLIRLNSFIARSGKGSFETKGSIGFENFTLGNMDIEAKAQQFKLANTDKHNLTIDLDSRLRGPAYTPEATGTFTIKNGFILLDGFGENTVEEIRLYEDETSRFSYYDSLTIDMEVIIERNFFVRNRRYLDLEVEIAGRLDAQKEKEEELLLFGSLEGYDGYLQPLNKRFEIENADMAFSGPADNPDLNVRSVYTPPSRKGEQQVELFYNVQGPAENPEFSFDSNPPMEQSDIICYTLFNKPCYSLDSWQSAFTDQSTASPTDLLAGVLMDEVEALATRELGVDVVQISNTKIGNETGTAIKTGWYLNEKTFFAILNEITSSDPRTLFILEYALSKTWDLILTAGEDSNRRGIDFRYQFDY